jgi:hypothetical protein
MSWSSSSYSSLSSLLDHVCVVLDVNACSSGEEGILSSGVPGMIIGENEVLDFLTCMLLLGLVLNGLSLCLGAVCVMMLFMHCFNTLGWLRNPSIASNHDRIWETTCF